MTAKEDITLILFVDPEVRNPEELGYNKAQLEEIFHEVCWLVSSDKKEIWAEELAGSKYLEYENEASKISALNLAVGDCSGKWIFYLESDEQCRLNELVNLSLPSQQTAYAVRLVNLDADRQEKVNYQIRLFPNPQKTKGSKPFQGTVLPDIYQTFSDEGWELDFSSLEIKKANSLYEEATSRIKSGTDEEDKNPLSLLACGVLEAERENFKQAGNYFLEALKSDKLFLFDELAAYNSLGEVLCEQGRWFEAIRYVQKSIDKCPDQCAPYLLMYKINSYIHGWERAYEYLCLYDSYTQQLTQANLDVNLPEGELKLLKGEILFKLNKIEQAFEYYKQFYEQRDGNISPVIIERLLIYAIETQNFDGAARYLGSLFNPYLPDKLDDVMEAKLHETLSLFMDNGWHDFVFNLYERLYSVDKTKNLLLRWTATLVKAGRVDKAQQLISREGVQFDVWAGKA